MNEGRIDWRTLIGILVALALGLALTVSTLSGVRAVHHEELERELTDRCDALLMATLTLEEPEAIELVRRIDEASGSFAVCLALGDGEPSYVSPDRTDLVPQLGHFGGPRPLVRTLERGSGPWLQVLLDRPGGGWLAVAGPLAEADARAASLGARVLRLTIPIGVIGLLLGALWVLRVKRSIRDVTEFVAAIAPESSGRRLPSRGAGTVGDLSRAANRLAWELEAHDQAVSREMAHRRAVLASMDDGVVAVDEEQRVLAINRTVLQQLGFSSKEPEGQLLSEVTRQADALELVGRCLAEQRRVHRRVEVPAKPGGRAMSLEMRASPIIDTQGGGCVLVVGDRTEIEHLERVRSDFVANVSHELKTPLTSVHGYLETLSGDDDLPPAMRKRFIQKALDNSDRLISIVRDLLSLARAESAGASIEHAPVRLDELVGDVTSSVGSLASESGITIDVSGSRQDEAPVVLGDRAALGQALGNLVENAIKYSPSGTTVVVGIEERGDQARITVTDQGPGIPPEHLDRLFERFYRVDKERSRVLGGTGLGLSIVRNVAVVHGGQVGVKSEVGGGSCFWIDLPVRG